MSVWDGRRRRGSGGAHIVVVEELLARLDVALGPEADLVLLDALTERRVLTDLEVRIATVWF